MSSLTLFYDGQCPLCAIEMAALTKHDYQQKLTLIDIHRPDFEQAFPNINKHDALTILHAQLDSGQVITGLDVTYQAWKLVNKKRWLVVLRWPIIRFIADKCYLFFAKNRYAISKLLTGKARCESQTCYINNQSNEKKDNPNNV